MGNVVGILEDLLRTILFFLDSVVYGLIPTIYKLFIYLSEINLYSNVENNPIQQLVSHIYVLLGIFMLFKVSFSLLQYLVDPNAFRDSSKGMGKLVTNVLVALVLLVSVPSIFEAASTLQTAIVQSNAIGQLILGTNASGSTTVDADGNVTDVDVTKAEEMATDLQFMLYGAFYRVNTEVIKECGGTSGVLGSIDMTTVPDCLDALNDRLSTDVDDAIANDVNLYSFFKHIPEEGYDTNCDNSGVCDDRNFGHFGALLHWREDGVYVIDYTPVISFLAGGYVIFLLISFSVDVAIRAIKLCFLQMVAPIAIVSYVDPKESISKSKLHNWIMECVSTYFSLFLRLATIFLVMLIIEMLSSSLLSDGTNYISAQIEDTGYDIWIYLFLVIGAFMFAKQIPKIIENVFGIKGSGELNLNPFKNAGMAALGTVGATAGAAVGGIAANTWALGRNVKSNWGNNINNFKQNMADANGLRGKAGVIKGAVSPVAGIVGGGISSGFRAGKAAVTGSKPGQAFSAGVQGSNKARYVRDTNQEAGYGFGQRMIDRVDAFAGVKNKDAGIGKMDKDIKIIQSRMDDVRMSEDAARQEQSKLAAKDWNSYQKVLQKDEKGLYKFGVYNQDGQLTGWDYDAYEKWYLDEMDKQDRGQANGVEGTNSIGRKDFDEFTSIQKSIDSMNAEFETLRQEQSRLKDVSDAKNNNGKK